MAKDNDGFIRSELKYSYGTYICSMGDYALFTADVGFSDNSFIFAKKTKYGITSHVKVYEEDTAGLRLYFLNDAFARLIGYASLSDMKKHLPSLQYHRRFLSLKAIDRASLKSRRKRQSSGCANNGNNIATPIFNSIGNRSKSQ